MSDAGMVAVDLGGTRLRVALFDAKGAMRWKSVVPTPDDRPQALAEAMRGAIDRCDFALGGAVVGVPGPIFYETGEPLRLPNLPGWEPHVTAEHLTSELGLRVSLANDADLAALGEHRFGAGRGTSDMLYVTSSTGVGGGVIIDGKLLHGRKSLAEAGHTIIELSTGATVEDLGSGTALEEAAGMDGAEVTKRALAGDAEALAVFTDVAAAFATGVYNLVHCFMPERVVIGGGVAQAGDLLLDPIRDRIAGCPLCAPHGPSVVVANGGDDVGLLGAYAFWLDEVAPL